MSKIYEPSKEKVDAMLADMELYNIIREVRKYAYRIKDEPHMQDVFVRTLENMAKCVERDFNEPDSHIMDEAQMFFEERLGEKNG